MPLRLKLRKYQDCRNHCLRFDLSKLHDPQVNSSFKALVGGKFAPLLALDQDVHQLTESFTKVITDAAYDTLGKERRVNHPWITPEAIEACDRGRTLKTVKDRSEDDHERYKQSNIAVRKKMREAKNQWINKQCQDVEECFSTNNTRKAFNIVKKTYEQIKTYHKYD